MFFLSYHFIDFIKDQITLNKLSIKITGRMFVSYFERTLCLLDKVLEMFMLAGQ